MNDKVKEYYERYWQRAHPPPEADSLAPTRSRLLWRQVERVEIEVGRLLDVGTGNGRLVGEALERDIEAIGIDVADEAISRARTAVPAGTFLANDVESLPSLAAEGPFDVVAAFEVIEHLLAPRLLTEGAAAVLRPGGYLAITTPFHGGLKNVAISLLHFDHHFAIEGEHIRFFTDRALRRLLESSGFAVESIIHFGRFPPLWAGVFVWARRT
ncbi:MAG: class I SAM-dependent methyltransferase [Actinomycetota bacterium]|nr:class I SAM-dependent methyltransferase [Actinomycetota bacterium]